MNNKMFLPLFIAVAAAVLGCGNNIKNKNAAKTDSSLIKTNFIKDTAVPEKFPPLPINYDDTKVLKNLYVIDREGVVLRQGANANAPALGKYPYGTKLDVICEETEWIAVMDRIQRDYKDASGAAGDVTQWEKVYVAKSALGKQDEITISPKDLNLIVTMEAKGKSSHYPNGHPLDKYLQPELIDKQTFSAARATAKDYLIKDTLSYPKKAGILELPLANGKKLTFKDKNTDSDDKAEFSYAGHYDFLKAFAITGDYWESGDVRLFDQYDGHLIAQCGDYPYFSPGKDYIITLYADPYESTGNLQLFRVQQNKVSPILFLSFKEWMPAGGGGLIFWGSDGNVYTAANHKDAYWNDQGGINEKYQYIRIKLLQMP